MSDAWLILETSSRAGLVALVESGTVLGQVALDPSRRHNRDMAPAVQSLLTTHGLKPMELRGVMVSIGPGSFTGLRVGIISAKMFAFATGCQLVAVPTFASIAQRSPAGVDRVDVISDGLQGLVYAQAWQRGSEGWEAKNALAIQPVTEWAASLPENATVTGPGLDIHDTVLEAKIMRLPREGRLPDAQAMYAAGVKITPVMSEELMRLEPLYLRPSSAEEQAAKKLLVKPVT
jgi:tRNA threonylcarbamoyladenosine biosynthesis protein TsaB